MPNWDETTRVYGRITKLQVEQIASRDQIWVWIDDGTEIKSYSTYLDEGATVALAQLQLLRDALERNLEVRLNFQETNDFRIFYNVRIFK